MRLMGLEPMAYGLKVQNTLSARAKNESTSGNAESVLAFCLALLEQESPELATVVAAWSGLPEGVRRAIAELVAKATDG